MREYRHTVKWNGLDEEKGKPSVIFLTIALALFLAFVGFFGWHTANMRSYELDYVKTEGTIVGAEIRGSSGRKGYYYVIAYSYAGQEYKFTDRGGNGYVTSSAIGTVTEIYVNPENPAQAEKVSSADYVSIICACFYAFFCATYSAGMNIFISIKGSSLKKRFLFVWGVEILLGIAVVLSFWTGLPFSGFGAVFLRIRGAIGVTVVTGLVALVSLLDLIITRKLRPKY